MHIPTTVLLSYITIISLTPIVSAHGKVAVVKGDAGGNGTALGILGGIVPGTGDNSVTEVDATVFKKRKLAENGLGKTKSAGANKPESLNLTMAQSGGTLPQVSPEGGRIRGVWHIVTTDGAGPIQAVIDSTATGTFSQGEGAKVVTNVPGEKGTIAPDGSVPKRSLSLLSVVPRSLRISKRAANVNKDFPFEIEVPAGTTCSGTVCGHENVCFMKIANSPNGAGPFGGVIAFQIANEGDDRSTEGTIARRFYA